MHPELFFFDEATALAAGHRPCAECRRDRFRDFRQAIVAAGGALLSATELDAQLDLERRDGNVQRRHVVDSSDVPDGAMVALSGRAHLVDGALLHPWSSVGYGAARPRPSGEL